MKYAELEKDIRDFNIALEDHVNHCKDICREIILDIVEELQIPEKRIILKNDLMQGPRGLETDLDIYLDRGNAIKLDEYYKASFKIIIDILTDKFEFEFEIFKDNNKYVVFCKQTGIKHEREYLNEIPNDVSEYIYKQTRERFNRLKFK